jgi:hypothetical protein
VQFCPRLARLDRLGRHRADIVGIGWNHTEDEDVLPFQEAILRAFQGGREAGNYLATGEDLGIQLEVFSSAPGLSAAKTLDSFCHTVTVVLVDRALLDKADAAMWDWLAECWRLTNASKARHAMLAVPMDERIGRLFSAKRPVFVNLQLLQVHVLASRQSAPRCSHSAYCMNAEFC